MLIGHMAGRKSMFHFPYSRRSMQLKKTPCKFLGRIITRLFLANFYFELDVEHIPQSIFGYGE